MMSLMRINDHILNHIIDNDIKQTNSQILGQKFRYIPKLGGYKLVSELNKIKIQNADYYLYLIIYQYCGHMFQANNNQLQSSDNSSTHKSLETPHQRIQRIKKTKNIRKEKVQKKRKEVQQLNNHKQQEKLVRTQRAQIQKQKNRLAAQLSRDRQKKYVQDLQTKIIELEVLLQKQICSKCKNPIHETNTDQSASSSSQQAHHHESNFQNHSFIQESYLSFHRDQSSFSMGSIGQFFMICMITVALASFSFSIDDGQNLISTPPRLLQAIEGQNNSHQPSNLSSTLETSLIDLKTLRNSINSIDQSKLLKVSKAEDHCKRDFIENYFMDDEQLEEVGGYQYSHYDNNRLLNCNRPQLIMKKDVDDNEMDGGSFFRGAFTVLLDNPQIMEVVSNKGVIYLDNIISLRGLYEIEVKFINIKKIISHNCLN